MAKLRYRGSEPADVPLLGRTVEPDEVIEVPDELIATPVKDDAGNVIGHEGYDWPEANWTVVSTAKKTAKDGE